MLMRALKSAHDSANVDVRRQVGALVWRMADGVLEVLLITSRDTGRWIIPKGWPMDGKKSHEVAARGHAPPRR